MERILGQRPKSDYNHGYDHGYRAALDRMPENPARCAAAEGYVQSEEWTRGFHDGFDAGVMARYS